MNRHGAHGASPWIEEEIAKMQTQEPPMQLELREVYIMRDQTDGAGVISFSGDEASLKAAFEIANEGPVRLVLVEDNGAPNVTTEAGPTDG